MLETIIKMILWGYWNNQKWNVIYLFFPVFLKSFFLSVKIAIFFFYWCCEQLQWVVAIWNKMPCVNPPITEVYIYIDQSTIGATKTKLCTPSQNSTRERGELYFWFMLKHASVLLTFLTMCWELKKKKKRKSLGAIQSTNSLYTKFVLLTI